MSYLSGSVMCVCQSVREFLAACAHILHCKYKWVEITQFLNVLSAIQATNFLGGNNQALKFRCSFSPDDFYLFIYLLKLFTAQVLKTLSSVKYVCRQDRKSFMHQDNLKPAAIQFTLKRLQESARTCSLPDYSLL